MIRLLAKWIIIAVTILSLPLFVDGISISSFNVALVVAVVFGILNTIVRPIILLIAFPITLITFGLFSFVVNAVLFWGVGTYIRGFEVDGFLPAFIGSLVVSVVGILANFLLKDRDGE